MEAPEERESVLLRLSTARTRSVGRGASEENRPKMRLGWSAVKVNRYRCFSLTGRKPRLQNHLDLVVNPSAQRRASADSEPNPWRLSLLCE